MVNAKTYARYREVALGHWKHCQTAVKPIIKSKKDVDAYNELVEAVNAMRRDFNPPTPEQRRDKTQYDETEVIVLSDLHFGKKVELEGKVRFDKDIAAERFKAITAGMLHLNASYMYPNHKIDELVIILLGDIVDGELIYEGQPYNQDMPLLDQISFAARIIKKELIDPASKMFSHVRVISVPGNHGEVRNERGVHVMHPRTNMDSLCALMLQMGCENLKNVEFEIAVTTIHTTTIRNWKFLLAHKLPPSTIGSPGRSKYGGLFERFRYDAVIRGHYHTPELSYYNTKAIIQNGSLVGVDDYSIELSFNTLPCQLMFTISDKRPVALFWQVDIGHRTKEAEVIKSDEDTYS